MNVTRPGSATLSLLLAVPGCRGGTEASYSFSRLDFPGAASTITSGINSAGHIVGWYSRADTVHGLIYRDATYTSVDYPGAVLTQIHGIGPDGELVGVYRKAGERPVDFHGFLLTRSGEFVPVDYPGHKNTIAQRILPDGTILGCYHDDDFGESMRGMMVRRDGRSAVEVVATMSNGAVPDGSKVVGLVMGTRRRGYVIDRGTFTYFDAPGSAKTEAWDINPSGIIVGMFADSTGSDTTHGFAWERGRFTTIDFPGATATVAFGINPGGDIVGSFIDAGGQKHGYVAIRTSSPAPGSAGAGRE